MTNHVDGIDLYQREGPGAARGFPSLAWASIFVVVQASRENYNKANLPEAPV